MAVAEAVGGAETRQRWWARQQVAESLAAYDIGDDAADPRFDPLGDTIEYGRGLFPRFGKRLAKRTR